MGGGAPGTLGLHDTIATSDPPLLPFLSNPPTETLAQRLFGTFFSDTRRDSAGKIRPSGLTILEEFGPAKRDELVRRAMQIYYLASRRVLVSKAVKTARQQTADCCDERKGGHAPWGDGRGRPIITLGIRG